MRLTGYGLTGTNNQFSNAGQALPEKLNERLLPSSHDSSETFVFIRQAIQTCCESHDDACPKNIDVVLPTFLLEVGPINGENIARLVENDGIEKGTYLALSYCWGGPQEVQLTTNTVESFKQSIQLDSLPKTLRDAATVTRRLGKKYLWIDALCIIQDDEASKQKELAQMARIYMNSFLTIQAAVPSSVKEGFLDSREPPEIPPVQICFSRDKAGGSEVYIWAGLPYGGKPDANTRWPST